MIMASTSEFDVAMLSVGLTMTVAVVWIIAHQWRKTRVAAYNARLKQLMIERGMSASEIERVLRADGNLDEGRQSRRHVVVGIGHAPDSDCCVDDRNAKNARS